MTTARTKLLGLIGDPVEHSMSPAMMTAALHTLGLDAVYLPLRVASEGVAPLLGGLRTIDFLGVNVTIPHKSRLIELVDELTPEAELLRAVNTVEHRNGRLIGHNTDGRGLLRALVEETGYSPGGTAGVILGAGGAAQGVAVSLGLAKMKQLTIANRSSDRAYCLAKQVNVANPECRLQVTDYQSPLLRLAIDQADLVVQTTTVGMHPHVDDFPVIDLRQFHSQAVVCDLVYNPTETAFLRYAREAGMRCVNGLGMLLYQGALALEIWTGLAAPIQVMRQGLQDGMAKF